MYFVFTSVPGESCALIETKGRRGQMKRVLRNTAVHGIAFKLLVTFK